MNMKNDSDSTKLAYNPVGGVLIRMPLLPIQCSGLREPSGSYRELAELALFVGSPSLYSCWNNTQTGQNQKLRIAVAKYMKRMSFRSTPYGVFAGVSWADISGHTEIRRGTKIHLAIRPDAGWLCELIERLEKEEALLNALPVKASSEVLIRAGRVWVPLRMANAAKPVNSVKATPPVIYALECAAAQPIRFDELVSAVQSKFGVVETKARALCRTLLHESLLMSSLRFPLSTEDPLAHVVQSLSKIAPAHPLLHALIDIHQRLTSITTIDSISLARVEELFDAIKALESNERKDILQVDAAFELQSGNVGLNVLIEMAKALDLLVKLSTARHSALSAYARAFEQRYQTNRVVPILEVLDETFGLGSPYSARYPQYSERNWSERDRILLLKLFECYRNGDKEIELTLSDLDDLAAIGSPAEGPLSADLFVQIVAHSDEAIPNNQFQLLISPRVGESGAGKTVGRFAQLLGQRAIDAISAIKTEEAKLTGDELWATISFWPDVPRMINVALTPKSGLPSVPIRCVEEVGSPQIPLSEIVVGLEHGCFFAEWVKTGQRLHVQSGNLLNREFYPDSGRLLVDIALQNQSQLSGFDWGIATSMPFLPRVVSGRVILSAARWNLSDLLMGGCSDLRKEFSRWRVSNQVPEKVLVCTSPRDDNQLLLDLSNEDDVEILISQLKTSRRKRVGLILQEYISTYRCKDVSGGQFVTELVGSFVRSASNRASDESFRVPSFPVVRQTCLRPLGTEWCYLRLDCAAIFHEEAVRAFRLAIDPLIQAGAVRKWFFVRYADPQHQLRLRLEIDTMALHEKVLPLLCEWAHGLLVEDRCYSYSFPTYDREVERFGGADAIEHVEAIFSSESEIISAFMAANPQVDRRLYALLLCHVLIDSFEVDSSLARKLLNSGVSGASNRLAAQAYRLLKPACVAFVRNDDLNSKCGDDVFVARLAARLRTMVTPHVLAIKQLDSEGRLQCRTIDVIQSLIHMQSNRLFGINPTAESITRGLLSRTYSTIEAMRDAIHSASDAPARLTDTA